MIHRLITKTDKCFFVNNYRLHKKFKCLKILLLLKLSFSYFGNQNFLHLSFLETRKSINIDMRNTNQFQNVFIIVVYQRCYLVNLKSQEISRNGI